VYRPFISLFENSLQDLPVHFVHLLPTALRRQEIPIRSSSFSDVPLTPPCCPLSLVVFTAVPFTSEKEVKKEPLDVHRGSPVIFVWCALAQTIKLFGPRLARPEHRAADVVYPVEGIEHLVEHFHQLANLHHFAVDTVKMVANRFAVQS
jgi:hypothetical protein